MEVCISSPVTGRRVIDRFLTAPIKTELNALLKNVFVDVAYTRGARLCNVLYYTGFSKYSIIYEYVFLCDRGCRDRLFVIESDESANHYKWFLLGKQFVYVDLFNLHQSLQKSK